MGRLCGIEARMREKNSPIRNICVYCGSSPGRSPSYVEAANTLGTAMAEAGIGLVYGGGDIGLMGAVAKACVQAGGNVKGIIPEFLIGVEQEYDIANVDGVDMTVVPDMHTRKRMMFEEADAFIAMPGGIGTLEEIVEIMTWAQLARHTKPMALLNVDDFWSPMVGLVKHMADEGFLHNPERTDLLLDEDPRALLDKILAR